MSLSFGFTFTEQLLLSIAGPLLAAALGTGAIVIVADNAQDRREKAAQQAQERRERAAEDAQKRRESYTLRERLMTEVLTNTSSLYWSTLHFLRAKGELPEERRRELRESLDEQYRHSRAAGERLKRLLRLHFGTKPKPTPEDLLHQVMDLLSVRYYHVIGDEVPSAERLKDYAKTDNDLHSGLTVEELQDMKKVRDAYHTAEDRLADAMMNRTLIAASDEVIDVSATQGERR